MLYNWAPALLLDAPTPTSHPTNPSLRQLFCQDHLVISAKLHESLTWRLCSALLTDQISFLPLLNFAAPQFSNVKARFRWSFLHSPPIKLSVMIYICFLGGIIFAMFACLSLLAHVNMLEDKGHFSSCLVILLTTYFHTTVKSYKIFVKLNSGMKFRGE